MKTFRPTCLTIICTAMAVVASLHPSYAAPAAESPRELVARHLAAVKTDDVALIMKDYASDAVIVRPDGTYIGTAGVRRFFEWLAAQHRDWNSFVATQEEKGQGVVFQTNVKNGQVEVFVVRKGKIVFQVLQPVPAQP